jgi:hypothetical protein
MGEHQTENSPAKRGGVVNQQIDLDLAAANRVLRDPRVTELHRVPGVTSLSIGLKMIGGRFTDQPVIVVHVREKQPLRSLPRTERIPRQLIGWRTDVQQEVDGAFCRPSQTSPAEDLRRVRPLRSGIAVAPPGENHGTLGFFATHQASGKAVLVSNYHVLFRDRELIEDEPHPIYQPTEGDDNKVAEMDGTKGGGTVGDELDCAFATLDTETVCCCCHRPIGHKNEVETTTITGVNNSSVGQLVTKTGISSGPTVGKVVSVNKSINGTVDYSEYHLPVGNSFSFANLIMIVAWDPEADDFAPGKPFSQPGDSGSAILNEKNEIIGLGACIL